MDPQIATVFNWLLALILSLSCHEWAHAYTAKLQGDNTARDEGRLTLNPIAHIDIMGTIVLPLVMLLTSGGMLGWAKPVPVNLRNLKNERWSHMLIAAAGPGANIVLSFLFIVILVIYEANVGRPVQGDLFLAFAQPMIQLNAILAFFNLIPIAPLDGGTVFPAFLPHTLRTGYDDYIAPYGMYVLIALLISGSLGWISRLAGIFISMVYLFVSSFIG
jgi:Zn-dependent protease